MAAQNPLNEILKRLDTIDNKLKTLPKIQKDIAGIKSDISLIKECVSTENAAKFPALVRKRKPAKGGGTKATYPIAASSLK